MTVTDSTALYWYPLWLSIMDIVGSDYVYLSDECSQDVFSLWSDTWSVGDPVNMPDMNCNDVFKDIFEDVDVQSSETCGDWLSDVLQSACPNTVAGYLPTSSSSSGEGLSPAVSAGHYDDVLSPTDSVTSPTATAHCIARDEDGNNLDDDLLDSLDECTSERSIHRENNDDIDDVTAVTAEYDDMEVEVNSLPQELDDKRSFAEAELESKLMSQRPQRVAARRAEIAFAREGSECDDDNDDADDSDDADSHFGSQRQLQTAEITSSRRGRSRAAEVNRNALNARINRQKKKAYMASLEAQNARLLSENKRMKSDLSSLVSERNDLVDEVTYLQSVLANDSVLAKLVESINGPPLKLSSRFAWAVQKRKDVEADHNYGPPSKLRARTSAVKAGGICLHVTENQLSMELCHRCARMASSGYNTHYDP